MDVALGFRAHSGWAVVVAVGRLQNEPVILERHRIETADPAIPGSKQPYHAAERLGFEKAEALIGMCRVSSERLARTALNSLIAELMLKGHRVVGAAILFASGRTLPDLATTLKSHALIHTAEGEFYREVLVRASEHCLLPVTRVKEREVWDRCGAELQLQIRDLGRSLGPPWRQDEKLASSAAWIALAESG